jgi:hypothetical protein
MILTEIVALRSDSHMAQAARWNSAKKRQPATLSFLNHVPPTVSFRDPGEIRSLRRSS